MLFGLIISYGGVTRVFCSSIMSSVDVHDLSLALMEFVVCRNFVHLLTLWFGSVSEISFEITSRSALGNSRPQAWSPSSTC